jgi:hypothetical protein
VQVETLRGCTMLVPREHAAVALKIRSRTFTHLARQARTLMPVTEKELDRLRMAVVDVLSSGAANYEEIEGRVPQELVRPFPAALRKLGLTGSLWLAINLLKEEGRVVKIQTVGRLDSTVYAFAQVSDVVGDDEVSGLRGELAIQELVRLYFLTEGPARMRDFAWWAGIHVTDGMRAAEGLGDSLVPIEVDGSREEFLIPRSRLEEFRSFRPEPTPTVNFLPYRDPYLKGQREIVNRFVRDEHFDKPFSRWKGKLINDALATVLWNGRVVGLWEWTHASGVDYVLFDEEAVDIAPQVEKQAAALDTFIREDLGSFRLQGLDYGRNQMTGIRELSSHWGQGAQAAVG